MSVVTDIILITGIDDGCEGDESPGSVDRFNDLIEAQGRATDRLVQVDGSAGGHKAMQCDVWLTAINHCDEGKLVEAFQSVSCEHPELVRLIINSEYADSPRTVIPEITTNA